jgi:hypothetical protein
LEADWEIKWRGEQRGKMMRKREENKDKKGGMEMLKPKNVVLETVPEQAKDLEHYFPASSTPDVVSYLLIPLAPTPTSRTPLPLSPPPASNPSLLPLPTLASMHTSTTTHTLRVSALFARLDAANVWNRGVNCSAYSHGREEGVCTVLKVEFVGWTAGEVRGVIGESGSGWCVLEERTTKPESSGSSAVDDLSETESAISGMSDLGDGDAESVVSGPGTMEMEGIDPSESFVLPTLDFSSSFLAAQSPSPPPSSTDLFAYTSDSDDNFSDSGSDFSNGSGTGSWVDASSHHAGSGARETWMGFGFSSDFASRVGSEYGHEPREAVF